jgi:hypothetical protein
MVGNIIVCYAMHYNKPAQHRLPATTQPRSARGVDLATFLPPTILPRNEQERSHICKNRGTRQDNARKNYQVSPMKAFNDAPIIPGITANIIILKYSLSVKASTGQARTPSQKNNQRLV